MVGEMVKPIEEELKSLNTKISQLPNQSNTLDASPVPSQNDRLTTVEAESTPLAPKPTPSVTRGFFLVNVNSTLSFMVLLYAQKQLPT